jgi:hypothetical protein
MLKNRKNTEGGLNFTENLQAFQTLGDFFLKTLETFELIFVSNVSLFYTFVPN